MKIFINGGTRGIGRQTALKFSENPDNRIVVTGRNESALRELETGASHNNIKGFTLDMAHFGKYEALLIKTAGEYLHNIDILINMAGKLILKDFVETEEEVAREIMEVNFFGPLSLIRAIKPLMVKGSHILNISSMGGFQGSTKYRGLSYYSASKAALSCMSECLAVELKGDSISVNALALGAVETEMFREAFPGLTAPVSATDMANLITDLAIYGRKYFNGKIFPIALSNP